MITGVFRGDGGEKMVTHIYSGEMPNPEYPYCSRGWQRKYFDKNGKLIDWEWSIFRNNYSEAGLCRTCQRRWQKNLPPIKIPKSKYNKNNPNHFITN